MRKLFLMLACLFLAAPLTFAQGNGCSAANSCTGPVTASGDIVLLQLPGNTGTVVVTVSGTYSATLQFEQSSDNQATWTSSEGIPQPSGAAVTSTTSTGQWRFVGSGMLWFRVRCSAYTSGTATVTVRASDASAASADLSIGANKLLSNLTDPTEIALTTLTFTGTAGLTATGPGNNVNAYPGAGGNFGIYDGTGATVLTLSQAISGSQSAASIVPDGDDVGDTTSILQLASDDQAFLAFQLGDGISNLNWLGSVNSGVNQNTFDDGSGNMLAAGYVNGVGGFKYNSAATSGHYLRGNGTVFLDSAIQAADLPGSLVIPKALVTTAATSDNVTVTGMTSSGHCSLTATNAAASAAIAGTYISAKTTNQITVTHAVTANMNYDILCTAN